MKIKIDVEIPEGTECKGCQFLESIPQVEIEIGVGINCIYRCILFYKYLGIKRNKCEECSSIMRFQKQLLEESLTFRRLKEYPKDGRPYMFFTICRETDGWSSVLMTWNELDEVYVKKDNQEGFYVPSAKLGNWTKEKAIEDAEDSAKRNGIPLYIPTEDDERKE